MIDINDDFLKDLRSFERKSIFDIDTSYHYGRNALRALHIPTTLITKDDTGWLPCIGITKEKSMSGYIVAGIRVIDKSNQGINIPVPLYCDDMMKKYSDLRYKLRNTTGLMITFPELLVLASPNPYREIFLQATDFKIKREKKDICLPEDIGDDLLCLDNL